MCEPNHSITQFCLDGEFNLSAQTGNAQLQRLGEFSRTIGGFHHFSKMGRGHSEGVGAISGVGMCWNLWEQLTNWECSWWNRQVHLDGPFNSKMSDLGLSESIKLAENSANEYCQLVSVGNLGRLRRFLEVSMKKTNSPSIYVAIFRQEMLNKKGRREFDKKVRGFLPSIGKLKQDKVVPTTKAMLGLTRKRELLVPEWADDKTLWIAS